MMKKIYILAVALVVSVISSSAQDVSRQESRKAKLEREIELLDQQIAQNASRSTALLSSLDLLRKNIENRKALVRESDKEIRRYADSIYLKQLAINRLKARVDTLTSHYSRLVKSAYKNRDSRVWYMYILASDNLGQAYRRFGYFRNLSTRMKEEAVRIRQMQEELEVEKARLAQLKKNAEKVKAERVKELERLRKDETAAANMVAQLKKDRKKYEKELKAKKKEGIANTFNSWTNANGLRRIDYVLYRNVSAPSLYCCDNTLYNGHYPSDHFPVYADFTIYK